MRNAGTIRKANVGISNDKGSEKLPHRKAKVSCFHANQNRVSRVLSGNREVNTKGNGLIFLYLHIIAIGGRICKRCAHGRYVR